MPAPVVHHRFLLHDQDFFAYVRLPTHVQPIRVWCPRVYPQWGPPGQETVLPGDVLPVYEQDAGIRFARKAWDAAIQRGITCGMPGRDDAYIFVTALLRTRHDIWMGMALFADPKALAFGLPAPEWFMSKDWQDVIWPERPPTAHEHILEDEP